MAAREEALSEPGLVDLAYRHDLPLVATNDAYFPDRDFYEAHDALMCIAQGKAVADNDRKRLTPSHYFRPAAEMRALFADLPEACDNTLVIARRCAFIPQPRQPILPAFPTADGDERGDGAAPRGARRARRAAAPGSGSARRRREPYRERLEFELGMIIQMGFAGYFLIVADFIQWAKREGIPVGPGRGSGAGSVVAWALTITDLDPLRFGLLFERFLNPERVSMPDFDIDFCQDRRDEVIRYVQQKYGRDRVAQIITFGKLQARAVLRDVGRVLGDALRPGRPAVQAGAQQPGPPGHARQGDRRRAGIAAGARRRRGGGAADRDRAEARRALPPRLDPCRRRGDRRPAAGRAGAALPRSALRHAGDPVQHEMGRARRAGQIRLSRAQDPDRAGARASTCWQRAGSRSISPNLPLDDRPTYELLARGDTVGVFQLEGAGMRDMLRKLKPDRFEDIIAVECAVPPRPDGEHPALHRGASTARRRPITCTRRWSRS